MSRLWARTASFESIKVGDQLPILVKWETRETVERFAALASALPPDSADQSRRLAAEEADGEVTEDVAAPPAALLAYVDELLEKAFPLTSIMARGSRLELEPLAPIKPEDTISLSGEVTGNYEEEGRRLVECQIIVESQNGQTVARASATVSL
jgi:acyl dehydratase